MRRLIRGTLPVAWSAALAVLVLWRALGPGYVLTYDMVWVPDLALRPDFLGLGSALPRAVPSDAVVAMLDEVIPGMVLQKAVLLGSLVLGGLGAARLVPQTSLVARLVAISIFQWNPFVVERLVIGHWPVLVGYAALPWLVLVSRSARRDRKFPIVLCLLLPLASLSASSGLMAAVVTLAFGLGGFGQGRGRRTNLALLVAVAAANAPWVLAGAVHAGAATTDSSGAEVFALHGVGWLPGPVAALGLDGIWNSEVVPGSRAGALGAIALVLLLALCAIGAKQWWRAHGQRDAWAFLGCWALGWGTAVLTWAVPGAMGALYEHVPGAGLVRDGARMLALCAPLVVSLSGHGAAVLRSRAGEVGVAKISASVALVLFPVAVLPDAAWGAQGALYATRFPDSYEHAAHAVDAERAAGSGAPGGDVVVLPFTSYRAPTWNGGHKVLDPLGRFLTPDFVVSDDLTVDGRVVEGEDQRAAEVRDALAEPTPRARAEALGRLGIAYVVTDRDEVTTGMPEPLAPEVAGLPLEAGRVEVVSLGRPTIPDTPDGVLLPVVAGWVAFVGLLLVGAGVALTRIGRRFFSQVW